MIMLSPLLLFPVSRWRGPAARKRGILSRIARGEGDAGLQVGEAVLAVDTRQGAHAGVEALQVAALLLEHAIERRHPLEVSGDGVELGVVEVLAEPGVITV